MGTSVRFAVGWMAHAGTDLIGVLLVVFFSEGREGEDTEGEDGTEQPHGWDGRPRMTLDQREKWWGAWVERGAGICMRAAAEVYRGERAVVETGERTDVS